MAERLLRLEQVRAKTGLGRSTIYKHVALGGFPKPVKFGSQIIMWPESEIDAWISATVQASRANDRTAA